MQVGGWRSRKAPLLGYFQVYTCRRELGKVTWAFEPQWCQRSLQRFPCLHQASIDPLIVLEASDWSLFLLGLSMLSTASFSSKRPDFAGLGTLSPPVVCVIRVPHIYLKDVITFVLHANWLLLPLSQHLELVFYQSHTFRMQPFSELLLFFPVPCTYSCICQALCHLHVYMPMI